MPSDKRRLSVGIWLVFPPGVASARGEGLFTQLSEPLKRLLEQPDVRVVVAMAGWKDSLFRNAMREAGIPLERLEIMTFGDRIPVAVKTSEWIKTGRSIKTRLASWWRSLAAKAIGFASENRILKSIWATKSYLAAIVLWAPVLLVAGLVSALYLLLFSTVFFCKKVAAFGPMRVRRFLSARPGSRPAKAVARFKEVKTRAVKGLYGSIVRYEHECLAIRAASRKDIDVWFAPICTFTSAYQLPKPLVMIVADLVYVDFPTKFSGEHWLDLDRRIRRLREQATLTVSFSEHVREHHVRRYLGVADDRSLVIRHAPRVLSGYLSGNEDSSPHDGRSIAARVIRDHFQETNPRSRLSYWTEALPSGYLTNFPFEEATFIFVCSQNRPHKNFLNLVRAVEQVLRRKYLNVKLFLSGRLGFCSDDSSENEVMRYVRRQHLEMDVISAPELPLAVMAAFYRLASLACMPSLFEGGFAFQFTESLSVGTPIVMSSIPVTREIIPAELEDTILFDPYDVDDMEEKIFWGLTHREELREKEMPLYEEMLKRTWNDVVEDYREVFDKAIGLHAASNGAPGTSAQSVPGSENVT